MAQVKLLQNPDTRDFMNRCSSCLINLNQPHETMKAHGIPGGPWEKIGIDLFDHNGQKYLATVDYISKYPCIVAVKNTDAQHTNNYLKNVFSTEGVPSELMSDSGPPFISSKFAEFAQTKNLTYMTSSPAMLRVMDRLKEKYKHSNRCYQNVQQGNKHSSSLMQHQFPAACLVLEKYCTSDLFGHWLDKYFYNPLIWKI